MSTPASDTDVSGGRIFFIGATGYIGGTVLQKLLALPNPPSQITLLIRDPKKAELLKKFDTPKETKLESLIGSYDEHDKMSKAIAEHDVVFSTADADDVPMIKAILEGMKLRKEKTGKAPIMVHTSGTGLLADDAKGMYAGETVFTDLDPRPATSSSPALHSIEELPDDALHRPVDLAIIAADKAGDCVSYIILPSTVWGPGTGQLFDIGFSNSFSQQIPTLCRLALDRGQAGMVGKGLNIWNHVHIDDTGNLFMSVYSGALRSEIDHGSSGFYFGESGEYTYLGVAEKIGSALVSNGWGKTSDARTLEADELDKYYRGSDYGGTNSRAVAEKSRKIGWRPRYEGIEVLMEHVREEVVRVEKKYGRSWS